MTACAIKNWKTAFVFAGGGSTGAAQVGMLRALLGSGICADLVVGSSVGAFNAAYFAGNPTLRGVARLETLWRGLRRADILPLSWRRLFQFLRGRDYLVTSDGLRHLLDLHLPYRNLEDAALPLHVVATNVLSGEAVVLSRGPATRAILASSAIPGVFAPVVIDGSPLCDGAISSNTPIRAGVGQGARRLIVLPTRPALGGSRPPRHPVASAFHAITLLTDCQFAAELDRLRESIECFVLPSTHPLSTSPFDFSRTSELLDQAYRSTQHWIDAGGMNWPIKGTAPAGPGRFGMLPASSASLPASRSTQSVVAGQTAFRVVLDKQADRAGTGYPLHCSTGNDGCRNERLSPAVEQVP